MTASLLHQSASPHRPPLLLLQQGASQWGEHLSERARSFPVGQYSWCSSVAHSVGPEYLRQLTACAMQLAGLADLAVAYNAMQNDGTAAAFTQPLLCSTFQVSRAQCA